jgi:hypothetical protein
MVKFEMTFLYQWRVGVGLSRKGDQQWWYRFNTLFSTREGRQHDEVLSEDEVEAASSS